MKKICAILLALTLALSLVACGTSGSTDTNDTNINTDGDPGSAAQTASLLTSVEAPDLTDAAVILLGGDAVQITGSGAAEEGGTVTVTEGGVYVIKGTLDEGRVVVNAPGEDVTLALENADITCATGSPLYIYKASSVLLWLPEGSASTLADGGSYTFDDALSSAEDDEPNACLYSKADLVIAGTGGLTVNGNYNNGVTSKDTLVIDGPALTVSAANNGITGKDSCAVNGGAVTVNAVGKGLKSDGLLLLNGGTFVMDCEDDAFHSNGSITVTGGSYTVATGDDAFHADGALTVSGGTVDITESYEGLEGATVDITGGVISIVASDDGINAAGDEENIPGQANSAYWIHVSGGVTTVDAGGDGIDSNGDILVTGGELYISGSTGDGDSAIDCDGDVSVSGGVVLAAGSSGMAQNFGTNSTQGSIMVTFSTGSTEPVTLTDSSGAVLVSFTPAKRYTSVVISTPGVVEGGTYTVTAGTQSQTVTMDGLIYGTGMGFGSMGGFPGGDMPSGFDPGQQGGGFPGGQQPSDDPPTKPN